MSDLLDSILSGQSSTLDTKKVSKMDQVHTPILYITDNNPAITFILDEYITTRELSMLRSIIEKKDIKSYQILFALKVKLTEKDLSTGIWKKYSQYAWDFSQYVPKWSKIVSFGRSMFSICHSNDLDCSLIQGEDSDGSKNNDKLSIVNGFYDHLLWKTSFFDNTTNCQVFPVDCWKDLINNDTGLFKDTFEYWFFKKQLYLIRNFEAKPLKLKKIKIIIVDNPNEWLTEKNKEKEIIGFDIETNSFDPWANDSYIRCVTIAFESNPYIGYYLKFEKINLDILRNFLKDRKLIGSNLKFDGKFCKTKAKISTKYFNIFGDTVQLQQICNETMRKGLKAGAWLHTPYGGYDRALDEYFENHPELKNNYGKLPDDILIPYASTDPCISLLVHSALIKYRDELDNLINKDNVYGYSLKWCYEKVVIPTLNIFMDVELQGMTLDKKILKEKELLLLSEVNEIENEILYELGEDKKTLNLREDIELPSDSLAITDSFWEDPYFIESNTKKEMKVSSPSQLGKKLEALGWTITEYGKNKIPKTGEAQLEEWSKKGYKLADKILKFREKSKLLTTYVGVEKDKSGMYKWLHNDEKIHTQYNNFGALSWRHTSKYPNGQNWTSHGDKATLVRSFITPNNNIKNGFLSIDFAGLQLRLITMVSKDEQMIKAFKYEGGDIHSRTAFSVILKYISEIQSVDELNRLRKESGVQADYINDIRFKAKCYVAGTKINTNFGPLEVEKLIQPINKSYHTPYNGEVQIIYDDKKYPIESTYYDETNETIEFELENGDIIEVTPTHTMVVLRGDEEIAIYAQDVIETDEILGIE